MAAAEEWSRWVVFFGLGGFVGNFALSLRDHAQNNFFVMTEWIPVFSSAVAIGFLAVAVTVSERRYLHLCLAIMGLQVVVGLVGFDLHLRVDLAGHAALCLPETPSAV